MKGDWKVKPLGQLCAIARGGSPRPIQSYLTDADDGINWIKISDATASGKYIYYTAEKIKPAGAARSRVVGIGDFILSNSMSFGRPYIMRTTGCIHDGWLVLSRYEEAFVQDFLYHLLGSPQVFAQFDRLAAGSTVRNLNIDLASRVVVPVPPLPEQRRIIAILDEAFEGIATAKANAEKSLQSAREILPTHVDALLEPTEADWSTGPLSAFVESISTGPFGSMLHKSDYVTDGVPLVNPINIVDGCIIPSSDKQIDDDTAARLRSYLLREGDIVVGRRGEIGRCAVVSSKQEGWLCGTGCFFIRPSPLVEPEFIAYLIRSRPYRARLEAASTGATMQNLSNSALSDLEVTLPRRAEQKRLLAALEAVRLQTERLCETYRSKLAALDELKKSLLHQAFSGALTAKSTEAQLEAVA
ncbi:MAG: restriction endonuclease subunit S [Ramlibacter sp.]